MSLFLYYVRELRQVTSGRRKLLSFIVATAMHAVGHALVALVAGALAVALTRAWGLSSAHPIHLAGHLMRANAPGDEALFLSAIGLLAVFGKVAAGIYATYVQGRVAGELGARLRLELFDALLSGQPLHQPRHADHGDTETTSSARAISALTDLVHEVELGLKQGMLGGLRSVAQIFPLVALLVWLAPLLALAAALVLVAFSVLLASLRSAYARACERARRDRAQLLEAADEAVRHADLWVSFGAEAKARSSLSGVGEALAAGAAKLEAMGAAMSGANEVLAALALMAAVAASRAGLWAPLDGERLLGFAVAFFLMYRPIRELTEARLALARASSAFQQVLVPTVHKSVLAQSVTDENKVPLAHASRRDIWSASALELRGLRLRHGSMPPLSLRVEPGQVVAICGPTGVGKTTLLRTLLGLEDRVSGDILYGGVSLGAANPGPDARPFAWVPQEAPLLADTLAANVSLGKEGVRPSVFLDLLGVPWLEESLANSRLGAGGRAVSGGERQWISLARAMATGQPVLLLDEPTSGLDPEAQKRVLEAIALMRGKRTILLVTHRPEPLVIADVVVRVAAERDSSHPLATARPAPMAPNVAT